MRPEGFEPPRRNDRYCVTRTASRLPPSGCVGNRGVEPRASWSQTRSGHRAGRSRSRGRTTVSVRPGYPHRTPRVPAVWLSLPFPLGGLAPGPASGPPRFGGPTRGMCSARRTSLGSLSDKGRTTQCRVVNPVGTAGPHAGATCDSAAARISYSIIWSCQVVPWSCPHAGTLTHRRRESNPSLRFWRPPCYRNTSPIRVLCVPACRVNSNRTYPLVQTLYPRFFCTCAVSGPVRTSGRPGPRPR